MAGIPLGASGGVAPISLLEVLTASGTLYLWSEGNIANMPSVLNGLSTNLYQARLAGPPSFALFGTTQTDTGSVSIENLSGNTVQRNTALALSAQEFIGAYVFYRLWRGDAEQAIFTWGGNVVEAELDEQTLDLSLEGLGNWSAIQAPAYLIDVACPLFFGSVACGSTSPTPCDQSYGNCSSIERFAGVIIQWDASNLNPPTTQIAQPPPAVALNTARAF